MNRYNYRRTQTIEKTGKIWKLQTLCAVACFFCGIALLVVADTFPNREQAIVASSLFMLFGFAWGIFARMGAWWFHG